MYRPSSYSQLPEIVKNLLIINVLFFLATVSLETYGINLTKWFALHQFQSPYFMPHQFITHIFMHSNFRHLFSNMFALWMFGKILENVWGGKRFLTYYMITGIGAAFIHLGINQYEIWSLQSQVNPNDLNTLLEDGGQLLARFQNYAHPTMGKLNWLIHAPTVGASGAVFGILLAFGMLFPNTLIYLFFTIPIKTKYVVIAFGIYEIYTGISNNPADNIAHFAHLGGMLFGYIILKYWQKNHTQFY